MNEPKSIYPLLCQAWGESDMPCAFIAYTEAEVRKFITNEWLGDPADPHADVVMNDLAEHDWKDEPEWNAEFEIGGVSFKPVYESNSRAALAAQPGSVVERPQLSEEVLADVQCTLEILKMWEKGEAYYAPVNGYDDPGTRKATIKDVMKSAKYHAARMQAASIALRDYFRSMDQFHAAAPTEAIQPPSQPSAARALAGGAEQAVPTGCLRCVTPQKCAIYGCCPNTWPSERPSPSAVQPLSEAQPAEPVRDERAEFEAWLLENRFDASSVDGQYVMTFTRYAWLAWQARATKDTQ